MLKQNFNEGWRFHLEAPRDGLTEYGFQKNQTAGGFAAKEFDASTWRTVTLPHDWGVELPFDRRTDHSHGHRPVSPFRCRGGGEKAACPIGWYRKEFLVGKEKKGKRFFLSFDGIYRDAVVWINGAYMDRHLSGYTGFTVELTDQVLFGEKNVIAVRVDASQFEGWWYEGAGIYRNVWLYETKDVHIPLGETFISSSIDGAVHVQTRVENQGEADAAVRLCWSVTAPGGGICASGCREIGLPGGEGRKLQWELKVEKPLLWDVDSPNLYRLDLAVSENGEEADRETTFFGIREIVFDPEKGCFLNGNPIELNGMCVHQDFAGVGVALPDELHAYKIEKLKEMGVNAYRTSHHPPAPEILDACDRLGMLVMDEQRLLSSGPEGLRQLEALVRRDRNHPSVVLWSIGNEEMEVQDSDCGARIASSMKKRIKKLDPTRLVTYGGNNGDQHEGINAIVDVRGFNYIRFSENLESYHAKYPSQPVVGSEEASVVMTRGIYQTDEQRGYVSAYDENTMIWGSTAKGWWQFYHERPYLCGAFAWTGFDYRGEPSPFAEYDNSSNFGIIDLCGYPKDVFYYYQSWWTRKPVLHLFPHWNHREGERVRVVVYTNCDETELFLNGKSLGTHPVPPNGSAEFSVEFQPGVLTAVGYGDGKECLRLSRATAGEPFKIQLTRESSRVLENGKIVLVTAQLLDEKGNPVCHREEELSFRLEGGKFRGVGNGDPAGTQKEQYFDQEINSAIPQWEVMENDRWEPADVFSPYAVETVEEREMKHPWREEPHPYFRDDYRIIWQVENKKESSREYRAFFSCEEGERSLVFASIYGGYEIYLDGEKLAEKSVKAVKSTKRSWSSCRIPVFLSAGRHQLSVICRDTEKNFGIYGGVYLQTIVPAVWKSRTFGGKCLLIVEKEKGTLRLEAFGNGLEKGILEISRE